VDATPLIELIEHRRTADGLVLVGIGGRGCAGKSTLAQFIPSAQVVGTDEFWDGSDFRLDRVRTEVLVPLAARRVATYESWNWSARTAAGSLTVSPTGVVVIEGVCALHRDLRSFYDVRAWVETPRDLRLARAVRRDGEAARSTWLEKWFPREEQYVIADDPTACADLIIDGSE
jgi:uridine kinase